MTVYFREREEESFDHLCRVVRKKQQSAPVIFDVGANIGQSIQLFKKAFPDCTIYSFEPNPEIFSVLKSKWGNDPQVTLNAIALNSKSGTFPFHVTNVPEASSLLHPDPKLMELSADNKYGFTKINVECLTIDDFCARHSIRSINILKLDVQGAELEVLKGANHLLTSELIDVIYIEVNFAESYTGQMDLKDLLILCADRGYVLWDISPFLYTRTGRLWYANAIFLSSIALQEADRKDDGRI